jgi:hypothetical protein
MKNFPLLTVCVKGIHDKMRFMSGKQSSEQYTIAY